MRMTPVKTKPISRRIRVKWLMWGIVLRMKLLPDDFDTWYNPLRLHSANNMTSPNDHERAQAA